MQAAAVKYYTGVGSRQTPREFLQLFDFLAVMLSDLGYVVRTGDADGADASFRYYGGEQGKQMYYYTADDAYDAAIEMAEKYHPNWKACSAHAKKLHGRNCMQVLGLTLEQPSEFVVCWTPEGKGGGGTGQAIRVAKAHMIPVFDFGRLGQGSPFLPGGVVTEFYDFLKENVRKQPTIY